MAFMKWIDDYSVCVEEIDNQHKSLINTINELFEAMKLGRANDVLAEIIDNLIKYAAIHFDTEERYFDQFNYEFSADHKEEHRKFEEEVVKFKAGFEAGNIILSMELFKFLKNWLINHMIGEDQKYKQCFRENGLQ